MKKIYSLLLLLTMLALTTRGQSTSLRGMYIDDFDEILGDNSLEDQLLNYAQDSSFNYLALYSLQAINLNNSANANLLASFMRRARENYGVEYIGAVCESASGFSSRIIPYNNGRTNPNEKFNVFNLEFEFWTNSSVRSGGYYCTQYLQQANCSCDTSGAFTFFMRQISAIDSLANANGALSETYLGWFNEGQASQIQRKVDRILLHAYRPDNSDVFSYSKNRLKYLASNNTSVDVAPIFSSEPDFMETWLETNGQINANNQYVDDFTADNSTWKQYINLIGYHWFTWEFMPKPAPGTSSSHAATITTSGSTTLCPGETVTLTATQGSSYSWSTGATSRSITTNAAGNYTCSVTINGNVAVTPSTTIFAKNNPTVTTTSSTTSGGLVSLTASASAGSGSISTYQWKKDNSNISGANSSSYTASLSGNYSVEVSNSYGCIDESSMQMVSVSSNVCNASDPAGMQSSENSDYNWRLSWDAGQTGDSIIIRYRNETNNGDYFYVRMLNIGQTYVDVNELEPNSDYGWRIKMVCGTDAGTYSAKQYFTTGDNMSSTIEDPNAVALEEGIKTFPNPANDQINISVNSTIKGECEISFVDLKGIIVTTEKKIFDSDVRNTTVNTSEINEGIYFVMLKNESATYVKMINVMH